MKLNLNGKVTKFLLLLTVLSGLYSVCALASVKADTSSKLQNIADTIVSSLNERDPDAFCSVLDFDRLAWRSAKKVFDIKTEQDDFVKGLKSKSSQLCGRITNNIKLANGQAKFIRLTKRAGNNRILVRLDLGESGFDYLEFLVARKPNRNYQIIDWYQLTTGQLMSDTMGAISRLMIDPDPGLLKKLLGVKQVDKEIVSQIRLMANLMRTGRFDEAYNAYSKMPLQVKNKRIMITLGITAASRSGDEAKYKKLLGELAHHHGDDPSAAFLLIDHYFYQGAWDKVLSSIDAIESRFGQDGMTELLRANVYLSTEDFAKLERHAKKAMEIEPDFVDPYFSLSTGYINSENFQDAVKIFDQLVSKFGYNFSKEDFLSDPAYSKFVSSKAFKNWSHINDAN